MARVHIFSISKTKEPWLVDALDEYSRRLRPFLSIEWHLFKNDSQLEKSLSKVKNLIALTPDGAAYTSESFSTWLIQTLEEEGATLNFVIGGAEGIPPSLLCQAKHRISLSPLTFTHQMARLILVEQIYRSFEIQKNSSYHK